MITMPNQIDPGTSVDVYDAILGEWMPGWVLVRPAFRCHGHDGWSYEVYQYPKEENIVAVTQVRRSR